MAVRHRRTVGDEIVFLVELALRAPREAPVEPRGDLASDPARSGRAYMAYHPEVDNLIVARIRRTNESISQAVRTLLRHGIAISDAREAEWRERCATEKDNT